MSLSTHLLSWLIWLPIGGGFVVLALGHRDTLAKWVSLVVSVLALVLSIPLWSWFKTGTAEMQFVERSPWISTIHSEFYIGVDGISMPLILLTTFTTVLIVIASWENVQKRVSQYMAAFLILEGLMIGVFAALDLSIDACDAKARGLLEGTAVFAPEGVPIEWAMAAAEIGRWAGGPEPSRRHRRWPGPSSSMRPSATAAATPCSGRARATCAGVAGRPAGAHSCHVMFKGRSMTWGAVRTTP